MDLQVGLDYLVYMIKNNEMHCKTNKKTSTINWMHSSRGRQFLRLFIAYTFTVILSGCMIACHVISP